MMLSELVPEKIIPVDVRIRGISDDSRSVEPGDLFCALLNGRSFVAEAVSRGAAAIACDPPALNASVPVIVVKDLRDRLGDFASRANGHPSHKVKVVAVTGTNGKTSFTHFLGQALTVVGMRTGMIGTMGFGLPDCLREPGLTTPTAVDLQAKIKRLVDDKCRTIVLEASSHGLDQARLSGLAVDIGVLTNLTTDHLDYHATIENYRAAKRLLFEKTTLSNAVLNLDDEFGRELASGLESRMNIVTFSQMDPAATVYCRSIVFGITGLGLQIMVGADEMDIELPLFGEFNVENVLSVIGAMVAMDYLITDISRALGALKPVFGRMDILDRYGRPRIIVDYAHNPDSLRKALHSVRLHFPNKKLHVVFGCGGERDKGKRALMGQIAEDLADKVILTSDNPRSENPEDILADIELGMKTRGVVMVDRREAIIHAISSALEEDVVLIAGKGHEDYQLLPEGRVPFSDYEVIGDGLENWSLENGKGY